MRSSDRHGVNVPLVGRLALLGFSALLGRFATFAQSQGPPTQGTAAPISSPSAPNQEIGRDTIRETLQQPEHQIPGSISGAVLDQSGAIVAGAQATLLRADQPPNQQIVAQDGQFTFVDVAPGPFQLTITAPGLAPQTISGNLQAGESYVAPQISLRVASELTELRVEPPREEIAEEQIKNQEKQRLFGVVPNFYVSYVPNAFPLTSRQKFELAWRTVIDPFTFVLNGAVAGIEQSQNAFSEYGQGAAGYGKRFGASYADLVSSTFIGSALLPSILKQDPRYFYKGTGTKRSRLLYALANSVICKGDNGRWQPNYSNISGSLIAGGISNLYYPKSDQNRVAFVFENTAIGIGETAVYDIFQEFFLHKVTSKRANQQNPSHI